MPEPKPGDRVRVTYEGRFELMPARGCSLEYGDGKGQTVEVPAGATVEVLASPVYVNSDTTEYQHGDVVRQADGSTPWSFNGGRQDWLSPSGIWRARDELRRPLTLLVRDGQVVQP